MGDGDKRKKSDEEEREEREGTKKSSAAGRPKPPFPRSIRRGRNRGEDDAATGVAGANYRPAGKHGREGRPDHGGDSGIGRSVAVLYAREGADVAIVFLPRRSATP